MQNVRHFGTFWDIFLVIVKLGDGWIQSSEEATSGCPSEEFSCFCNILQHFVIFGAVASLGGGPLMHSVVHAFLFVKSGDWEGLFSLRELNCEAPSLCLSPGGGEIVDSSSLRCSE